MRIAPEIRHHLLGAAANAPGYDDPVLAPGCPATAQTSWLRQRRRPRCKGQLPLGEGGVEPVEILLAKDPCEGFDWEEEPSRRVNPPVLLGGQGAAGHEECAGMLVQVLLPGMEDHRWPRGPHPASVGHAQRCTGSHAAWKRRIEDKGIALEVKGLRVGEGKDTVEIRNGQEVGQGAPRPTVPWPRPGTWDSDDCDTNGTGPRRPRSGRR